MSHIGIFGDTHSREYDVPAGMPAPEPGQRTVTPPSPAPVASRTQPREMTPQERLGYRKALEYRLRQDGKTLPANMQPVPRAYEPVPSPAPRPVPSTPVFFPVAERQDAIGYRERLRQRRMDSRIQVRITPPPPPVPAAPAVDLVQETLEALAPIVAEFPPRASQPVAEIIAPPADAPVIEQAATTVSADPAPESDEDAAATDAPAIAETPAETLRKRRRRSRA